MNARNKIILGFVMISSIMIVSGSLQYIVQQETKNSVIQIHDSSLIEISALQDINSRLSRISFLTLEIHEKLVDNASTNELFFKEKQALDSEIIQVKASLDKYSSTLKFSADEVSITTTIQESLDNFFTTSSTLIQIDSTYDFETTKLALLSLEQQSSIEVQNAIDYEMNEVDQKQSDLNSSVMFSTQIMILGIITSLGIWIYIMYSINNSFTKSINSLKLWIKNIAEGRFESVPLSKRDDFFDVLQTLNTTSVELEDFKSQLIKNERLTTIGEISARLTHDIRTPLTAIKSSIQIIEQTEKNTDNATLRKYIPIIKTALNDLNRQINDVLGYVRVTPLETKPTSIIELIEQSINDLTIPDNVQIIVPKNDVTISCDPQKIKIVIQNLLTNSIDAIGQNPGKISINIKEMSNEVVIDVEDTGSGISSDDMSKLFEPLFTTKTNGTGLGLVSCKNIVEQHQGKIFARNSVNGGAIFTLTIPKP